MGGCFFIIHDSAILRASSRRASSPRSSTAADGLLKETLGDHVKDIRAILAEHELDEATAKAIEKAVGENYRTIAEVQQKADRIKELEKANGELADQVKALEGDGEQLQQLRDKVAEYEKAEADRKAKADEDAKRDNFRALFDAALDGREFANELMRETVFEKAYAECQNVGKGAAEAIEAVTKDVDGVWVNPQRDPKRMPSAGDISNKKPDGEDAKRAFAAQLFGGKR